MSMDNETINEAVSSAAAAPETGDASIGAEASATVEPAEAKPYLGGDGDAPGDNGADGKDAKDAPADGQKTSYAEADYLSGIKKDTALLGDNENVRLDEGYIKAMSPVFNELGIAPDKANRLANAFAKAQIDAAREQTKSRVEYFEKMKQESLRRYTRNDFTQINAGIDKWFKPGGVMNSVIRNSELGADPEFLALMHHLGASSVSDGVPGTASGAGDGRGKSLSEMW